jgi:hypothetical protein
MKYVIRLLLAASVLGIAAMPATAQETLRPVGELTFTPEPFELQSDVIAIRPENGRFRSFRIEARDGSADIRDVRLIYRDGATERVRVRERLRAGGVTAILQKQGRGPVREVEINYIPQGRVTLVLRADSRPAGPPPVEWAELGCRTVGFLVDRDTLTLNSDQLYRAIRLRSQGFDIELLSLSVRYANGQRETYRVNTTIPSGGRTTPIDLRGERRRIAALDFTYATRTISNVRTRLCIEGLVASRDDEDE